MVASKWNSNTSLKTFPIPKKHPKDLVLSIKHVVTEVEGGGGGSQNDDSLNRHYQQNRGFWDKIFNKTGNFCTTWKKETNDT